MAAARKHGVTTMFTLSGGHVFPVYDGAVTARPPMPIIDVRHEQTAVFAAEATARLTRTPGLAVLTAGPGVTNGVSAVTTAHMNGSPLVVLAGRAPDGRWGSGSLQELDHPPLLAPVTKRAWTVHAAGEVGAAVDTAFALAATRHRGPVFVDASLEALFGSADPASSVSPDTVARPVDVLDADADRAVEVVESGEGEGSREIEAGPGLMRAIEMGGAPGSETRYCRLCISGRGVRRHHRSGLRRHRSGWLLGR